MTRTLEVIAQARRVTQPIPIVRPRDPSIHRLGFSTFRLHRSGDQLIAFAHLDKRNTMSAFTRLAD